MVVSSLVEFEGEWIPREQQMLLGAIADVEQLVNLPPHVKSLGKPWLCHCIRLDGVSLYMAHRAGSNQVLCTYGVVQLGLDILEFGVEVLQDKERIMA